MNLAYLLLCVSALFCGVSSMWQVDVEHLENTDIDFDIRKKEGYTDWEALTDSFHFEERLEYIIKCRQLCATSNCNLHWEVEPYGLKSSNFQSNYSVTILMSLKLNRDYDNFTIGCYYNKEDWREQRRITFHWKGAKKEGTPSPSSLPDSNDAEQKCYQKNNIEKCAFFIRKSYTEIEDPYTFFLPLFELQQKNVKWVGISYDWVPVVAGVAGVAVLLVLGFICYRFLRKRKQDEPTHAEPPIAYAEIRIENDGQRERGTQERENNAEPAVVYAELQFDSDDKRRREKRGGGNSHLAKILWFKTKLFKKNEPQKNEPKLKNASENTRSETEDTRIGTVERINDLYSTAEDARIGTVEQINDLYSTGADTRRWTVERFNDLYSTAADARKGTAIEQCSMGTADQNHYSTVWR